MSNQRAENEHSSNEELTCGIIMPIASMGDYTSTHWQDVKSIIKEATDQIEDLNFKTEIVSDSEGEVNVIHKNIVWNIYNSDIVVCDISGRNPNVLFELGMRLTFDKPTVIIKDNVTPFLFDTSTIETIQYPMDLRFAAIVKFKSLLASKIKATYLKSKSDSSYSTFLGNFGQFHVPKLDKMEVTEPMAYIIEELSSLKREIQSSKNDNSSKLNRKYLNETKRDSNKRNAVIHDLNILDFKYDLGLKLRNYFSSTSDERDPVDIYADYSFYEFLNLSSLESELFFNFKDEVVKEISYSQNSYLPHINARKKDY